MLSEIIPILMMFSVAGLMFYLAYDSYKSYRKQKQSSKP